MKSGILWSRFQCYHRNQKQWTEGMWVALVLECFLKTSGGGGHNGYFSVVSD